MKIIISGILFLFAFTAVAANQKAITDKGDVVILKDNGTWKYESEASAPVKTVTNKKKFKKPTDATFELKSTRTNVALWIDPKKWSFKKEAEGKSGEYALENKATGNIYGTLITEKLKMSLDELATVALINAQSFDPDAQITKKEYRTVNGQKIIYLEMTASSQGIDFVYFGYYISNTSGVTQLVTYTLASNLSDDLYKEVEKLLNGLTVQSK